MGLAAKSVSGEVLEGTGGIGRKAVVCSPNPRVESPLVCTVAGSVAPYDAVECVLAWKCSRVLWCVNRMPRVVNRCCECEWWRVPGLSVSRPVTVSEALEPFGVES